MADTEAASKRSKGLLSGDRSRQVFLVLALLVGILLFGYVLQVFVERNSLPSDAASAPKEKYEIAKPAAEIRPIRSDTYGSIFWLKAVALFVTVGGAVGGYLAGQDRATRKRLRHEGRQRKTDLSLRIGKTSTRSTKSSYRSTHQRTPRCFAQLPQ